MKYKLGSPEVIGGITLHRVIRLNDGQVGGYIEHEGNLSQVGGAWVYGNARVYGDAWVYGNARVYGDARVGGDADVCGNARVFGNALVCGNAGVYGDARVGGDARVYGNVRVFGNAGVYGDALVCGDARVSGDALVCGNAEVYGDALVGGKALFAYVGQYFVSIYDDNIRIGCQFHSSKKWLGFTKEEISSMDIDAAKWWAKHKKFIFQMHKHVNGK